MGWVSLVLGLSLWGQPPPTPAPVVPAGPFSEVAGEIAPAPTVAQPPGLAPGAYLNGVPTASQYAQFFEDSRGLFESDHAFDGFTGPMSNPVQFKDPRSLTEARFVFMNNWARPNTPVIGSGGFQVYALQLRLAVTERLQLFADKDGIIRLSPNPGRSVTGLANLNAGFKYALIRDVENQFLMSFVLQYEIPTGYANVFQNQGSGLLAAYLVLGKEFWDHYHLLLQFGQNTRLHKTDGGYFLTSLHLDRRIGSFVPFYEVNWFYYNQSGNFLPESVDIEGGGWLMLGTSGFSGRSYVTNAVGVKFNATENLELGLGYEFQLSNQTMLLNNMLHAQVILRY